MDGRLGNLRGITMFGHPAQYASVVGGLKSTDMRKAHISHASNVYVKGVVRSFAGLPLNAAFA